ncbi:hypothetical protein PHLCEN_2v9258 [Hermanssonia centrifuga]|uniref:Uncharacterized protein n=1 Tax=Hermanssonia centrifuga TaxID=98765 RepID=A0A2R6NRB4_9APHY|nr:hypothetical protein PHLCEN_2v9258 [Hermanssonia centrifuga]
MSDDTIIIYDDDDGQIQYTSGPWYPLKLTDTSNSSWQHGTLSGIDEVGSFAFNFSGSHVSVYGTLRGQNYTFPTPTESTYSIDGVVMKNWTAPQLTTDSNGILFFDSGEISIQNHTLSVSIINATNDFPYYLDYLTVEPPPPPPPQTTSTSSQTASTSHTIARPSSLTSSSSAPDQGSGVASHIEVGAVVGGVVGGVVVLIAVLFGLFVFWRKRKKSEYRRGVSSNGVDVVEGRIMQGNGGTLGNSALGVTPYMLPRDYGTASAPMVPQQTAAPLAPGSISGTPTGVQTGTSEKVILPQMLNPFADPIFQSNEDSSGVDQNTISPSLEPPEYTGNGDISVHSAERVRSLNPNGAQSQLQPTLPIRPSSPNADFWMGFPRQMGGPSTLSSGGSEVLPAYSAR